MKENPESFKGNWFNARVKLNRSTVRKYFEKFNRTTTAIATPQKTHQDPLDFLDPEQQIKATTLVKSPSNKHDFKQEATNISHTKQPIIAGRAQVFTIPPQHRRAPTTDDNNVINTHIPSSHDAELDAKEEVLAIPAEPIATTTVAPIRKSLRPHKRKILGSPCFDDEINNINDDEKSPKKKVKKTRYQLKKDNNQQHADKNNSITINTFNTSTGTTNTTTTTTISKSINTPSTANSSTDSSQLYCFRKDSKNNTKYLDDLNYTLESSMDMTCKNPLNLTTKVLELPAFISMTTKLITRENLNDKNIPEKIRRQFPIQNINKKSTVNRPSSSFISKSAATVPAILNMNECELKKIQQPIKKIGELGFMRQTMNKCSVLLQEYNYNKVKLPLMYQRNTIEKLIRSPDIKASDITCFHNVLDKYIDIIKSLSLNTKTTTITSASSSSSTTQLVANKKSEQRKSLRCNMANVIPTAAAASASATATVIPTLHNNPIPMTQKDPLMRDNIIIRENSLAAKNIHKISIRSHKSNGKNQKTSTVMGNVVMYTEGGTSFENIQCTGEESILPDYPANKKVMNIKNEKTTEDDIMGD